MPGSKILCISLLLSVFISLLYPNSSNAASDITDEIHFIDSLDIEVNSWFHNPDYSFDDVLQILDKTENRVVKKYGTGSLSHAYVVHKKGVAFATIAIESDQSYMLAIHHYIIALNYREKLGNLPDSIIISDIILGYSNIGRVYLELHNPYEAIKYILKGITIADSYPNKHEIINNQMKLYILAARTYYEIGDYDNTIKYYSVIINYQLKNADPKTIETFNFWKTMALIEIGSRQAWPLNLPNEAIKNLMLGIQELLKVPNDNNNILLAGAYHKLGLAHNTKGNFQESIKYYKKSVALSLQYSIEANLFDSYLNIGTLYLEANQLNNAEYYLKKAKSYVLKSPSNDKWIGLYDNLGDLAFEQGNYFKSLEYDNKALCLLLPEFKPLSPLENPPLITNIIADKPRILRSLTSRAYTLLQLYYSTHDVTYLESAYGAYSLSDFVMGLSRSSLLADASKTNLVEQAKPIYENAIETCWQLYKLTQNDSCMARAFEYSEKSRAIILLDAVKKTTVRAKLPDYIAEQEKQLNLKTNYFEKQAALNYDKESIKAPTINYFDSLLYYRRKHEQITNEIKILYPTYHTVIYEKNISSINDIMNFIGPQQSFIEYFVGNKSVFAFIINKGKANFINLGRSDSLNSWVEEFNTNIRNREQQFIVPGNKLYNYLIASVQKKTPLHEQLIIVPDASLNNLSFDALVTTLPKTKRIYFPDFKEYLIYKHQISYALSASSLQEAGKKTTEAGKTYLGIAPEFKNGVTIGDQYFEKLENNYREVKQAKRLFRGSKILDNNNSREEFNNIAPNYNIIHLATHAIANNENGDLSYILFKPDEDGKLYAKDLYTLTLNSDLIVLSACQTGLGPIMHGEGTISLARGFIYAGSSSVISSLWNVREKSNMKIILQFYKGLKDGQTKDQSLREAKLKYLASIGSENQEKAHPFYWAPMVCIGDMSPTNSNSIVPKNIAISLLVLLAIISLVFCYKRFNR